MPVLTMIWKNAIIKWVFHSTELKRIAKLIIFRLTGNCFGGGQPFSALLQFGVRMHTKGVKRVTDTYFCKIKRNPMYISPVQNEKRQYENAHHFISGHDVHLFSQC